MTKFGLRSLTFSCNLIVLSMVAVSISIFKATRTISTKNKFVAWPKSINTSSQIITLLIACISLIVCVLVFTQYYRTGHRGAERTGRYQILFSIGWFIFSIAMWVWAAAVLLHSRHGGNSMGLWGWSCQKNDRTRLFQEKVDFSLVCRLQVSKL